MYRFVILLFVSFSLISCSTKTTDQNVIPQTTIVGKDITASEDHTQDVLNAALLVPKNNSTSLIQAAQIALDETSNNVNLTFIDSNLINSAPESLLADLEKQQVIIGPLYGPDTEKLVSLMQGKNIPILSLSNDSSLKGDSLLIMGISPSSQTAYVMNYALSQGINDFHLLLPETKYGHIVNSTVENMLSNKNNMRYFAYWYEQDEFEKSMNQLVNNLDHKDSTQAIFIPQGDKENLRLLNNALAKHQSKVKLIGLQGWNNHDILSLLHFNGAMFLKKSLNNDEFIDKFSNAFGAKANNIDYITYNTLLMVINMNNAKLPINKLSIINNNQESGKYSDVRLNDQGLSFYQLSIAKISNGTIVNID